MVYGRLYNIKAGRNKIMYMYQIQSYAYGINMLNTLTKQSVIYVGFSRCFFSGLYLTRDGLTSNGMERLNINHQTILRVQINIDMTF